ncbi:hypothetical protein [Gordonia mangrovi]|uniref:hypothetical protein n=1 Tax=Gordonia mangrovi TaxID=2665643 RepID=UPI0021ACFCC6|nr:hypothetical protein [Gordonia mangrovi]MDY6808957.1 hypothetical protein [Actinomycetota bacterium]UVF79970.1 hypothetical protein NWF22_09180 [Gordonia mangrovi]
MNINRIIAGALIGGAAVVGVSVGAGSAEAKIDPGQYKMQSRVYGFIPYPDTNVKVVGNRMYQDFYGVGPSNASTFEIDQTPRGGITSNFTTHPLMQWYARTEWSKTKSGYRGTNYVLGGIPVADYTLKKTR